MKVIFMGAPAFAVPSLIAVSSLGADIVAVYTKAPRPAGRRGLELTKTPVHLTAERLGLHVETPATLRSAEAQQVLRAWGAELAVVAAYGLLLPAEALAATRLGCFNLHGSLLPRWRGAAPVQRALMAGDKETGVSIMRMEIGLDTGPIAGEMKTAIQSDDTSEELTARLSALGAETLTRNWDALAQGDLPFLAQRPDGVVYAHKIDKAETPIDWGLSAERVRAHIHGLAPFPGATAEFTARGIPERLKILRAEVVDRGGRPGQVLDEELTIACGVGAIRALRVQRAGRNVAPGAEFMRSRALRVGDVFTVQRGLPKD